MDSKSSLNNFTAVVSILAFELKWDMSWICLQENFSAFPIHKKLIKLMQWNHSRTECQGTGKNCLLLQHLLFQIIFHALYHNYRDEQCPSLNRVSLYPGFIVLCSQASFKAFSLLHCQSLGSVMMWYVGSRFDWASSLGARLGWQVKHWRRNVTHFSPHVKCPCCDKNLGNYGKLRWLYL